MKPNIIVIGGNHHNTLGVIRSLGRVGILPLVIETSGLESSFILKSKYIQKYWCVNNSEEAIELLLLELKDSYQNSVIIACHDKISSLLDINRDRLLPYYILPGCQQTGRVTEYMDKNKMSNLAASMGINVPKTKIISRSTCFDEFIPFPCITKPIESRRGSKKDITICSTKDSLQDYFRATSSDSILVQEYIDKEFEFQLIGCSINSGEEIIIPGVSKILRQSKVTNTGFLHYQSLTNDMSETVKMSKAFIKKIGYSGLFSVEYLRGKDGVDYFMEINFRNDGNAIAVTNSGVNLPYIWYLASVGEDYGAEIKSLRDEYVMPEFDELTLLSSGNITITEWINDMRLATSYMDFADDDTEPTDGWKRYYLTMVRVLFRYFIRMLLNI